MINIHNLLEMVSILLGFTIFLIAWQGNIGNNSYKVKIASIVWLCTSLFDLGHMMSNKGYLLTSINDSTWIVCWFSARLLWSCALIYSIYHPPEKLAKFKFYLLYALLFGAAFQSSTPIFANLTYFQVDSYSHPVVYFILSIAIVLDITTFFILQRFYPGQTTSGFFQYSLLFNIAANISFILTGNSETNILAHGLKVLAYYYVLRATFHLVIKSPYENLIILKEKLEELAAKNAKLYKESEQQRNLVEDTLAKIGAIISSQLNLKDTLEAIADMVADMMHARQNLIALCSNDQAHLQVVASYGINTPPAFLPLNESLSGKVITENKAMFIDDLSERPDIFRPQLIFSTIASTICAPLVNDGQVIGIIEAYSSENDAFSDRDALLLTALGHYAGAAIASAMLYEETKLRLEEERYLSEIAQAAAASIDINTIVERCTAHTVEALNADIGLGFLVDKTPGLLTTIATINFNYELPSVNLAEYSQLNSLVYTFKPSVSSADIFPPLIELYDQNAAKHVLVLPLALDKNLLGVIIIGWQRFIPPERLKRSSFASLMGQQIALGLEKARLYTQVKSMALSDGLTGLANRRNFDMFLNTELRRATSLKRPISLIMLDLDKFKIYNDTYGHLTGDKLLAQIGQILHNTVRSIDFPARYGGEEFSIILPECSSSEAAAIAENVRQAVEDGRFPDNMGTFTARITASLGVASYDPMLVLAAPDSERLIAVADKALYQAKQSGRNRVVSTAFLE
jgi:two-component system cell cycle response regulator